MSVFDLDYCRRCHDEYVNHQEDYCDSCKAIIIAGGEVPKTDSVDQSQDIAYSRTVPDSAIVERLAEIRHRREIGKINDVLQYYQSDIDFLLSLVEKGLTKRAEPSKMHRLLLDALEAEARGDVTEAQRICHRISEEGAADE